MKIELTVWYNFRSCIVQNQKSIENKRKRSTLNVWKLSKNQY